MSGLHPQYMLSKRFPVHAAIELQDLQSIASLLGNERDARYHLDRKLTNNEVTLLEINVSCQDWGVMNILSRFLFCTKPAVPGPLPRGTGLTLSDFVSNLEQMSMMWTALDKLHCSMPSHIVKLWKLFPS